MRRTVLLALIALFVVLLPMLAADKNMGVADRRQITFSHPVRVGEVMLPAGTYEVRHTMQGAQHIMEFKQLEKKNPAETKINCTLVPLQSKAKQDTTSYKINAANEYVLTQMVFAGDTAEHHF